MDYTIRKIQKQEYPLLDNFLYETPSLAISLYKEYRGFGIGTAMMKEILALLRSHGYKKVSLSVQKSNYAVKMYQKIGFEIVRENEEELVMVCHL